MTWPAIFLSGLLKILGTVVGGLLGPVFSKRWQHEQWRREKRLDEYKEIMSLMTDTYMFLMQRFEVQAQRNDDAPPDEQWLRPLPTDKELATYKVLRDRVFIAKKTTHRKHLGVVGYGVTNFRHTRDAKKFAGRYSERSTINLLTWLRSKSRGEVA